MVQTAVRNLTSLCVKGMAICSLLKTQSGNMRNTHFLLLQAMHEDW